MKLKLVPMTAYPFLLFEGIASDTNYQKAIQILEKVPLITKNPNSLEDVLDIAKKAIKELSTDIDFCEDPHTASLYALEWLFNSLYQEGLPLEKNDFFQLCQELIPKERQTKKEKNKWYNKI